MIKLLPYLGEEDVQNNNIIDVLEVVETQGTDQTET